MKIMINYDFLERISEVKGKSKVLKLIKHERKFITILLSTLFTCYLLISRDIQDALLTTLIYGVPNLLLDRCSPRNIDKIENNAKNNLLELSSMLQDLNVKTNYELLLESYMYEKKYKLCIDENKIPYILESKYIMVPSYNYSGDIVETSILQEHEVGDKNYVLTLGKPKHDFKLAFSGA